MSKKLSAKELSVNQGKVKLTAENGNLIVNTVDENGELVEITSTTKREQEISSLAVLASESESLQTIATSHSTYGAVRTDIAKGDGSSQQTFVLDDRQFSSKPIVTATLVGNENDPKHYVLISDISETSSEGIYQVTFEFSDEISQYQSDGTTLTNYKLNILAVVDGTDSDLDGIPDHTDTDDDNDGILDVDEPNPILTEDEDSSFYFVNDTIQSSYSASEAALPNLSEDGNSLAIAYPNSQVLRVFDIDGSNGWVQRGDDITIESSFYSVTNLGEPDDRRISLSGDGNRVAVSFASSSVRSHDVQVFEWANNSWSQIGGDVTNSDPLSSEIFASSIELDYDGSTLVTGSIADTAGSTSSKMRVFTFNGSSWSQQGSSISVGAAVAINRDGSVVAATPRQGTHTAQIYEWNTSNSSWDQKGSNISMGSGGSYYGRVSLSSDGNTALIANPNVNSLKVYDWNNANSSWEIRGSAISHSKFRSASISNDGLKLLVASKNGHSALAKVMIYAWSDTNSSWDLQGTVEGPNTFLARHIADMSKNGERFAVAGSNSSDTKVYQISNS
jgi:hypothetical protein